LFGDSGYEKNFPDQDPRKKKNTGPRICNAVKKYRGCGSGFRAFLTPGSRIGDGIKIRIWDELPRLFFPELRDSF
jgi:hypothetical protein